MGILSRIKKFVTGESQEDEWELEGDKETDEMPYYNDYDEAPTVIYSDSPQMPQEIKGGGNPDRLNNATMREVARINAQNPIPGQVVSPQQRRMNRQPAGAPRRFAGAPRQRQQQQFAQQQLAQQQQQQWQQQEWERQQWEQQQQEQDQQMQQQAFYQQQQAYYQQAPQVETKNKDIERAPAQFGEPYYEMIVANGKYHFYVDLPGVKPSDIAVSYVNMNLVITGKRQLHSNQMAPKVKGKGNKGKKPDFAAQVTIPPFAENFNYSFYFPRVVDQNSFKSSLADGVLHIEMDILGESGPGGVQISIG